jgi:PAS domain S-box-containing protein
VALPPDKYDRDLATARESLEALRRSEERFRLLVESVKDYAIFLLDPNGVVATWNIGAQRIKGFRADEVVGRHFSLFYPDEDIRAGKCEMELERAVLDGRCEDEGWRIRKDGTRFWANVVITVLRDSSGTTVGFAKVTRDLTERRAAEEERSRLGQLARARIAQLAALSEALALALTIEHVGRVVVEKSQTFAHADVCTLYLLDETNAALELVAQTGTNPEILAQIQRITSESQNPTFLIGIGEAGAAWIETPEQYAAYLPAIANLPLEGARAHSFWCVPLVAEGRTIGMIGVGFHQPRLFSDDEREFVQTFARQSAQALARARRLAAERTAAALADRLRASLATTLRSIGDGLIATDAQGFITLMNGVAEALTGWSEAEAQGQPLPEVFRIVNEQTRAIVPNPVEKVLGSGAIIGLANHTLLIARGGRETSIDDSGAPIRADNGEVTGVVLVFRDVTERKREDSRRAFLIDATTALAESLDYEFTVARVAALAVPRFAAFCAVDLGVDGDSPSRRLAVATVDPAKVELSNEPALVVPLLSRQRALGTLSFGLEVGREFTPEDRVLAEELARRCANAIENARAYQSEQNARRAADDANRAKDEFLAIVSHELRTPLNAIMGWAKIVTMQAMDPARLQRAHQTIERNAVAMAQLIEDLLDMSRVISGKLRIEVQSVNLERVVDAAFESIRPAAAAKTIELVPVVEPNIPMIMGDPTRLQQVVWNLLSNAVKFTPKGGRVEVSLRRVESSLEIAVVDTGKGIAPDFLPNVFEPFRQEDAGPARYRGGLGLGLAITRQLVELHGGRIVAHSEGDGRGARFEVTLPISAIAPAVQLAERTARQFRADSVLEKPEDIRGLRILVVDDEEDARRLVAMILEDCGCQVATAGGVDEAMRKFDEFRPELLLSDIGMPGQSGYDLIRKVRGLPRDRGGDIPAAALTAYARAEDRRNMLNAGYSIHLPKPVEPAELVAVVATLSRFLRRV